MLVGIRLLIVQIVYGDLFCDSLILQRGRPRFELATTLLTPMNWGLGVENLAYGFACRASRSMHDPTTSTLKKHRSQSSNTNFPDSVSDIHVLPHLANSDHAILSAKIWIQGRNAPLPNMPQTITRVIDHEALSFLAAWVDWNSLTSIVPINDR